MDYLPQRSAAALGLIALSTRLFFAIAIDLPQLLNAGWLCALAACALTLPLALCLGFLQQRWAAPPASKCTGIPARIFCGALCLFSLHDLCCVMRFFTLSASHTLLEDVRPWLLTLLLAACALLGCLAGVRAVGGAARVGLWVIGLMLAITVLVQLTALNPGWLAPLLGPGLPVLARPLPHLAGLMTGLTGLWLMGDGKAGKAFSPPALVGYIALAAGGLLALWSMLAPMMTGVPDTRLFYFDRLLTNGRVTASLQLVLLLAWYGGMLTMMSFSTVCSARLLTLTVPPLPWPWAVCLCVLGALGATALSLADRQVIQWINLVRWVLVTLPILGASLFLAMQRKGESPARPEANPSPVSPDPAAEPARLAGKRRPVP